MGGNKVCFSGIAAPRAWAMYSRCRIGRVGRVCALDSVSPHQPPCAVSVVIVHANIISSLWFLAGQPGR